MLLWIQENLATVVISLALAAAVILIARKLIRDRRAGRTSCGCGCSGCAMHGQCHKST